MIVLVAFGFHQEFRKAIDSGVLAGGVPPGITKIDS